MRKITVSKILLSAFVPTIAVGACSIITSCSIKASASTKTPIIDVTSGKASIDIDLSEQPKDNEVVVSVSTTKGEHQVFLVDEEGAVFDAKTTATYQVHNRKTRVYVAFKDFAGDDTSSSFDLKLKYRNKSDHKRTCSINGFELKVHYEHPSTETVHILDLNDFHGAAAGYGDEYFSTVSSKNPGAIRIAKQIEPILSSSPGSIFLTAGDNTSGESFSTSTHAESMFPILKSMKARYCAVGNHAFEWGIEPLEQYKFDEWGRTEETEGNYFVTANVLNGKHPGNQWEDNPDSHEFEEDYQLWKKDKVEWADPYKILNMNGHLVCLIGLTTDLTINDGNTETVKNLDFIKYNASLQYANRLCKEEVGDDWYDSIEAFILLTHVESSAIDDIGTPDPASAAAELAADLTLPKVQGIISAHSHKTVCGKIKNLKYGNDIFVGQAETAGRKFLDTQITFDNTKPTGQRFKSINMEVKNVDLVNTSYSDANKELLGIRQNPGSEYVKQVIDTYDYEKDFVKNKLKSVVAHREHSLLYPAAEGHIGHEYYCSDTTADPLGAWLGLGQVVGFASYYEEDIKTGMFDYPAVSFLNIDTCNYQLPEPKPEQLDPRTGMAKVTLKELFSIQGYENPMSIGYLSIWQLANVIDYMLSGSPEIEGIGPEHCFNYDYPNAQHPKGNEYYQEGTLNDLRVNKHVNAASGGVQCYYNEWTPTDYKGMPVDCRYLCGPLQWYGMRFEVEHIDNVEDQKKYGREYQLAYMDAPDSLKGQYDKIPKIWIIDPSASTDPENPYQDIYNLQNWKRSDYWIEKNKYIPVTISSFLDTCGNAQSTMFTRYFTYNNESEDNWPYLHYSNLSREMLEELCRLTETRKWGLHFDLSNSIIDELVIEP